MDDYRTAAGLDPAAVAQQSQRLAHRLAGGTDPTRQFLLGERDADPD
jgi:hypothetical protein